MNEQSEVEPWEYDDRLDDDCWACGGEGYVADCFDGFCINAEDGCELCMRRCDFCNSAKDRAAQSSPPTQTKGSNRDE